MYSFASIVPTQDAVLTPNGQQYDTAYGNYLEAVIPQTAHSDPAVAAQMNATAKRMTDLRNQIAALKVQCRLDYIRDCPNGIDPFTDQPTTLAEYAAVSCPHDDSSPDAPELPLSYP